MNHGDLGCDYLSFDPDEMPLDDLICGALSGKLAGRCRGGGLHREMLAQRWYRLESARAIIDKALSENRGLTAGERGRVDELFGEADRLAPVIDRVIEQRERELSAPLR